MQPDTDTTIRDIQATGSEQALGAVLAAAVDAIAEGFVVYDPNDRLVFCNDAYKALYALSAPVMVPGTPFADILRYGLARGQYPEAGGSEESREAWLSERLALHATADRRIVQQAGPDLWLQIEERRLPCGHTVGIRSDISSFMRVQVDRARLGAIVERSAHELFLVDPATGMFVDANEGARRNLGYSQEELLRMSPVDVNADYDDAALHALLAPLIDGRVPRLELETSHRRKDGTVYPCRITSYLDRSSDGDTIVAFSEDLSHQRALESEVARGRRDLRNLISNIPDIVTRAHPDTTLFFTNERYMEFLDLPEEQLLGHSFLDFVPEALRDVVTRDLAALTPENPVCHSTETNEGAGGASRTMRWSNLMVFEDRTPVEIISVGRDVTDLHHANEALTAANDELQGFAYAASHDLRSPIQTMHSLLDVLREDYQDDLPEDARMILDRLSGVANRMMQLSSGVLDYARLSGMPAETSEFAVDALLEGIVADLEVQIAESDAQVHVDPMPVIHGVRAQIAQVFQNLIGNAIKFRDTERMPRITVSTTTRETEWVFSVRDNGIGLAEDQAKSIFAPFQRLHGRHRFSGSGLGLTICRKVVAAHGGTISAAPNDDGPGSTFTFTIRKDAP